MFKTDDAKSALAKDPPKPVNKIDPTKIPTTNTCLTLLKSLMTTINTAHPGLLTGDIATYAGFSGSNYVGPVDWNKLTYYLAFRLPYKADPKGKDFDTWYDYANQLRLCAWKNLSVAIKRLAKDGDEEIYTSTTLPTSSTSPAIVPDPYTTKTKYQKFITLNTTFEGESFDTSGNTTTPLYLFLLSNSETPYFNEWLKKRKSRPFWVYAATPNQDTFDQAGLTFGKGVTLFCPNNSGFNFNRYAWIDSITNAAQNKVMVKGFAQNDVEVLVYDHPKSGTPAPTPYALGGTKDETFTVKFADNGDLVVSTKKTKQRLVLHDATNATKTYRPNYKALEGFSNWSSIKITYKHAANKYYISVLKQTVSVEATVTLPTGLTLNDLLKWPIFENKDRAGQKQYVLHAKSNGTSTIPAYKVTWKTNPKTKVKKCVSSQHSGLTVGIGIDILNSLSTSSATDKTAADSFMTNATTTWSGFTTTQKDYLYNEQFGDSAYTTASQTRDCQAMADGATSRAEKWWLRRPMYDGLDMNNGAKSFDTMVQATVPFLTARFLGPNTAKSGVIDKLKANGLKAEMNVIEKYALATLKWNAPGSLGKAYKTFVKAINQHDYAQFMAACKLVSGNNNKKSVVDYLKSDVVKQYYRDNHLNVIP